MNSIFSRDIAVSEEEKMTADELRFVYGLILDGHSDSDILNEYASLEGKGRFDFPRRNDENFVRSRRREMEVASDVLKDSIKKIVGMLMPRRKDEHLAQITEISAVLLQGNLGTVTVFGNVNQFGYASKYTIRDGGKVPVNLNTSQLIEMLRKNVREATERYGTYFFYDCYGDHLNASMGEKMEAVGGFWPAVESRPYDVIKAAKSIMENKQLAGMCPLCQVENQLPPFIKTAYSDLFQG